MRALAAPFLVFVTTVFIAMPAVAQPPKAAAESKVRVKVRISADEDADAKLRPYSIIRSSPNAIMMLRSGEFDVRAFGTLKSKLDLYDRDKLMYVRSQEPVMQRSGQEKLLLEDLVYFAGRPMLIARGSGTDGVRLYWQQLDPNLTKPPPAFEKFAEFPIEIKERRAVVVQAGASIREPFGTAISRDSTKMMVFSPELRDAEDDGAFFLLSMVDKDMTLLWNNILRGSDNARRTSVMDVEVDNLGNGYVLVRNEFAKADRVDGQPPYEVVLHRVTPEGTNQVNVSLGGNFIGGGLLRTLEDNRVGCIGIYSTMDGKKLKPEGNFIALFDATTGELGEPRLLPFQGDASLDAESDPGELDDEKTNKDGTTKDEKKDQARMGISTDVISVLPRKDGGFFLVNEVNYVSERIDAETGKASTSFYHGPVQARSFDKEGNEQWSTFFRRWTSSGSPLIGLVFCVDFDGKLFLFLLDSEEMAERRKAGEKITPKHARGPYSAYVMFDEKGAFKVKPVLKNDTNEDFIGGWDIARTGTNEYIALGTRSLIGGKFLPVKIEFSYDTKK